MEIKITIEDKTVKAMNALAAAVERLVVISEKKESGISIEKVPVGVKKIEGEIKEVVEAPAPAQKATKLTLEEVRSAFVNKNTPEKRPLLKDILTKYGAKNISSIKAEDFENIMTDIQEV